MNSLSLFFYAAEVISKLPGLLGPVIFGCCVYIFIRIMNVVTWNSDNRYSWNHDREEKKFKGFFFWPILSIIVCSVLLVLTPSKQTMYLIAGSEATEAVATSQTGQEILGDLKEVIRSQLEQLKADTKK